MEDGGSHWTIFVLDLVERSSDRARGPSWSWPEGSFSMTRRGTPRGSQPLQPSMRRLLLTFAIPMLLLSSCGGFDAKDGGSSQPHSGVRGSVVLGPNCPVEIAGSPCPDRAWQGKVQAFTLEGRLVREVNTDEQGALSFLLSPGPTNLIPYTFDGPPRPPRSTGHVSGAGPSPTSPFRWTPGSRLESLLSGAGQRHMLVKEVVQRGTRGQQDTEETKQPPIPLKPRLRLLKQMRVRRRSPRRNRRRLPLIT